MEKTKDQKRNELKRYSPGDSLPVWYDNGEGTPPQTSTSGRRTRHTPRRSQEGVPPRRSQEGVPQGRSRRSGKQLSFSSSSSSSDEDEGGKTLRSLKMPPYLPQPGEPWILKPRTPPATVPEPEPGREGFLRRLMGTCGTSLRLCGSKKNKHTKKRKKKNTKKRKKKHTKKRKKKNTKRRR